MEYRVKNELWVSPISLKKVNLKGFKQLYKELKSPDVLNNLSLDINNSSDFRRYLIYLNQQWNYHNNFSYIISLESEGPIGMITLFELNFTHKRAQIGIWIGKNYQKKGYAIKAVDLITDFAFHSLQMNRLEAQIFPSNKSSISLFTRAGFKAEGIRKEYVKKGTKFVDIAVYSLLKRNFSKIGSNEKE